MQWLFQTIFSKTFTHFSNSSCCRACRKRANKWLLEWWMVSFHRSVCANIATVFNRNHFCLIQDFFSTMVFCHFMVRGEHTPLPLPSCNNNEDQFAVDTGIIEIHVCRSGYSFAFRTRVDDGITSHSMHTANNGKRTKNQMSQPVHTIAYVDSYGTISMITAWKRNVVFTHIAYRFHSATQLSYSFNGKKDCNLFAHSIYIHSHVASFPAESREPKKEELIFRVKSEYGNCWLCMKRWTSKWMTPPALHGILRRTNKKISHIKLNHILGCQKVLHSFYTFSIISSFFYLSSVTKPSFGFSSNNRFISIVCNTEYVHMNSIEMYIVYMVYI